MRGFTAAYVPTPHPGVFHQHPVLTRDLLTKSYTPMNRIYLKPNAVVGFDIRYRIVSLEVTLERHLLGIRSDRRFVLTAIINCIERAMYSVIEQEENNA